VTTRLILIALLAAVGCKDKKQPESQPAPGAKPASDAWIEQLPELTTGTSQLLIRHASNVVRIAADGSISAGATPETVKTVTLDGLEAALGLVPVVPRRDTGFASVEGGTLGLENPTDIKFAKLGHPALASGYPTLPNRLTSAYAIAHPSDVSGGIIVLAEAAAPATVLVDVLAKTGGFVAVRTGKTLAALPLAIDRHPPAAIVPTHRWHELRLTKPIELGQIPSYHDVLDTLDAAKVTELKTDAIDLLVAPETKVQDVVNGVRTLRAANIDAIGFGRAPAAGSPDAEARKRDHAWYTIAWDFAVAADKLDPAPLRAAFDALLEPMGSCYVSNAFSKRPKTKAPVLGNTVRAKFVVHANQKVDSIDVTGADAAVTKCVIDLLAAGKFPKPASAVQLDVRIAFVRW
jgi:hypothetical protein